MNGYIRKIVTAVLALIFVTAVIVGVGVMLSVRNVNVEYIFYSDRGDSDYRASVERLDALKGENLASIEEDDIISCVDGSFVTVVGYEKIFPCTLNVVLRERVEVFARANASGGYDMFDSRGEFMYSRRQNINDADASPDVLLDVDDADFAAAVEICGYFRESFGTLRNLVRRVVTAHDVVTGTAEMTLEFYSGLKVVIVDYDEYADKKIAAVHDEYQTLDDGQKLRGSIYAVGSGEDGSDVFAAYNHQFE